MRRFATTMLLGGALGAAMAGAAWADDRDDNEPLVASFQACGKIAADAERLACFDKALAEAPVLQARIREQRKRRTAEDFGLSATQIADREKERYDERVEEIRAGGGSDADIPDYEPPEPEQIESTLADIYRDRYNHRVFILANGQIWIEAANSTMRGRPENGAKVTIKRSTFGGFRLKIEGTGGYASVMRSR